MLPNFVRILSLFLVFGAFLILLLVYWIPRNLEVKTWDVQQSQYGNVAMRIIKRSMNLRGFELFYFETFVLEYKTKDSTLWHEVFRDDATSDNPDFTICERDQLGFDETPERNPLVVIGEHAATSKAPFTSWSVQKIKVQCP